MIGSALARFVPFLLVVELLPPPGAARLTAPTAPPPPPEQQAYDMPAQPLADALDTLATRSRISIAFEPVVVATLRSAPLRGSLTPPLALRHILAGTGLAARFTGPRAAIIYDPRVPAAAIADTGLGARLSRDRPTMTFDLAVVRAPRLIGQRDRGAVLEYVRRAESAVRSLFARDRTYQGVSFQLRIAIAIDARGRIDRATVVRPSGSAALDGGVPRVVLGQDIGRPPASGLPQPLRFDIAGKGLNDGRTMP
ncbi:STN domain-containing protein [Sphingomonas sp. PB4P5]|uniref:STN domain-containing protein n=1 Tax=Parasphingomonas puruogangriensis TaxID=3096155 RepID=UPI002FCB341D